MRTDFDVAMLFRVWSVDSVRCVADVPVVGAGLAGRSLEFCGFAVWRVVMDACWLALVWTASVLCARSLVWSVVWVFHVGDRVVVDCRSVRDSLESGGFVVLPWLVVGGRSVLVWTGSDFVVWFPIQSA